MALPLCSSCTSLQTVPSSFSQMVDQPAVSLYIKNDSKGRLIKMGLITVSFLCSDCHAFTTIFLHTQPGLMCAVKTAFDKPDGIPTLPRMDHLF